MSSQVVHIDQYNNHYYLAFYSHLHWQTNDSAHQSSKKVVSWLLPPNVSVQDKKKMMVMQRMVMQRMVKMR